METTPSTTCNDDTPSTSPQSRATSNTKSINELGKKLLEAARLGDTEQLKKLISNGVPLTTDWLGTTPLHLASIFGHTSSAEILITSGIDRRTKLDKAPLHFACQHSHLSIVKLLVKGGAEINVADMLKMTPLHWAVESNNFEICMFLLQSGARTNLKNKFGKTPLQIAGEKSFSDIVELLSDEKFKGANDIVSDSPIPSHSSKKKLQKTKRFAMIEGTWTGGCSKTKGGSPADNMATVPPQANQHSIFLPNSNIRIPLKMPNEMTNPAPLHSGIPVITPQAMRMLPPYIHAIPLDSKTTEPPVVSRGASLASTATKTKIIVTKSTSSKSTPQKPVLAVAPQPRSEPTVPVNIPFSLLTQIIDRGVSVHACQSSESVVGIDTSMGTIPIIPSNSQSGLQLVAMATTTTTSTTTSMPRMPVQIIPNQVSPFYMQANQIAPYNIAGAAGLNMLAAHNGGFDLANARMSPMFLPNGFCVQPQYIQLQPSSVRPLLHPPAFLPPFPTPYATPSTPVFVHPSYAQQQYQPHIVYLEPQQPIAQETPTTSNE